MEPAVEIAFTDDVRRVAADRFGAAQRPLELLGDHENFVFSFINDDGEPQILRITHPIHRSAGQILAELDWVNFLRANDVAIVGAIPSLQGAMVETIGDEPFFAVSFEYAPGGPPTAANWNTELFEQWGRLQGRTHRLAGQYVAPDGVERRFSLLEEPYLVDADENFSDKPAVLDRWQRHRALLESLPTGPSVFGLIHTDLYQANFHVDDGAMVMFDSDDCGYAWFVEDISSSLYYASGSPHSGDDRARWVAEFLPAYWRGYRSEHPLDDEWLDVLPDFLMGRSILIYSMLHTKWDLEALTDQQSRDLAYFRRRIETDEAWWTGIDFRAVATGRRAG